eukprot:484593-Rhodomonas_salina.1
MQHTLAQYRASHSSMRHGTELAYSARFRSSVWSHAMRGTELAYGAGSRRSINHGTTLSPYRMVLFDAR